MLNKDKEESGRDEAHVTIMFFQSRLFLGQDYGHKKKEREALSGHLFFARTI